MIWWLFGHLWWGLPSVLVVGGLAAFALGAWPLVLATLGRLPPRAQVVLLAVLVAAVAGSGMYAKGKADGEEGCRSAQEAAEDRADAKGARVAKGAQAKADKARATIQKETDDVQVRIQEVVRTVPATCPPMPDELRELLQREVEATRARVPAAADG